MTERPRDDETRRLLGMVRRGYDVASWHGPNLKGALRGVGPAEAGWRAGPGRHSIAENALHAAYWKYVVRRRMLGQPRGSFARTGSNWFAVAGPLSAAGWKEIRALLDEEQRQLLAAVEVFDPGRWEERPAASRFSFAETVEGVAFHDIYHAGQVQLIKRIADSG
jgi:hypothetical protein